MTQEFINDCLCPGFYAEEATIASCLYQANIDPNAWFIAGVDLEELEVEYYLSNEE